MFFVKSVLTSKKFGKKLVLIINRLKTLLTELFFNIISASTLRNYNDANDCYELFIEQGSKKVHGRLPTIAGQTKPPSIFFKRYGPQLLTCSST